MTQTRDSAAHIPIDTSAFDAETPTAPAVIDLQALARGSGSFVVDAGVPLDAIPKLVVDAKAIDDSDVPPQAVLLAARIDGISSLMQIVSDGEIAPDDGARLVAQLVRRGFVKLQ
jgi:hypothetical protein